MTAAHGDINNRASHMKLHTPAAPSLCARKQRRGWEWRDSQPHKHTEGLAELDPS